MMNKKAKAPLVIAACVFSMCLLGCSTPESECEKEAEKLENRQVVNAMGKEEFIKTCVRSVKAFEN